MPMNGGVTPAPSSWTRLWRHVLGAVVLAALGLSTYAADTPFLPLTMVELGIHESSHWATIWAPRVLYVMAGSIGQVLVPLLVSWHLARRMGDPVGGALGLGWAGLSAHGVAVYIADAPYERLELVGGNIHDWAYLLGPEQFNDLGAAAGLASAVRGAGILMVCAGVVWCLWRPVRAYTADPVVEPREGGLHWSAD